MPDRWVITGGLIIIASGIFIVYREVGEVTVNRYLRAITSAGAASVLRRARGVRKSPSAAD